LGTWLFSDISPTNKGAGQIGTFSNHRLDFITNNSSALMTLTTDGKLGIGTVSPISKLAVYDNTGAAFIGIEGTGSSFDYSGIALVDGNGSRYTWLMSHRAQAGEENGLLFQFGEGTSFKQTMFLDSSGQVGIGMIPSNTDSLFTVAGGVNIENLRISGGNPGIGEVLTAIDTDGNAEWQTPATGTDSQTLSLSGSGNGTLNISNGNRVFLPDSSNTNELQNLGLFGPDSITISDGQGIDISYLATENEVAQDLNPINMQLTTNTNAIAADNDGSATNEIQNLGNSVSGDDRTITISGGTSTTINVADGDASATNEAQTISKVGRTVTLTDANGSGGGTFQDSILTEAQVDAFVANNGYSTITDTLDIIADADRDTEILLDNGADDDVIRIKQRGTEFIQIDSGKIYLTNTNANVYIGDKAGEFSSLSGSSNVGIGSFSLNKNTGIENTALGFASLLNNTSGSANTAIGQRAMNDNEGGFANTVLGYEALGRNVSGSGNVALGFGSGILSTGSNNIFIGNNAGGTSSVGDDKLYIENSNSNTPLIFGDFLQDSLVFNGKLFLDSAKDGNGYSLPGLRGTNGQILTSDGSGKAIWQDAPSVADNLGNHTATSNLDLGSNSLVGNGGSSGLQIHSNGNVGIGTITPQSKLDIAGAMRADTIAFNSTFYGPNVKIRDADTVLQIISPTNFTGNKIEGVNILLDGLTTTTPEVIGVRSQVSTGDNLYGGYFTAKGGETTNIAMYADADISPINPTTQNYSGYFNNGNVFIKDSLKLNTTLILPNNAGANKILRSDVNGVASWVDPNSLVSGDNLGNHALDSNLKINGSYISNDGDDEGLRITDEGIVYIEKTNGSEFVLYPDSGKSQFRMYSYGTGLSSGSELNFYKNGGNRGSGVTVADNDQLFEMNAVNYISGSGNYSTTLIRAEVDGTVIGTNVPTSLSFTTRKEGGGQGSSLYMRSNGNVGIGSSAFDPDSTLTVDGGIMADAIRLTEGADSNKVLTSVDASGKAIWEDISSLITADTLSVLKDATNNERIDLTNGDSIVFRTDGITRMKLAGNTNSGRIAMGIPTAAGRLHVHTSTDNYTGYFTNSAATSIATGLTSIVSGQSGTNTGIDATISGATSDNVGVNLTVNSVSSGGFSPNAFGVRANVTQTGTPPGIAYGGKFDASSEDGQSFGVRATATGLNGTSEAYGIYSKAMGGISQNWSAYLDTGNVFIKDQLVLDSNFVMAKDAAEGKVLTSDANGVARWDVIAAETCPAGMLAAGPSMCVDSTERAADTWFEAAKTCTNAGYKLPTWAEWYSGTTIPGTADKTTDNWEWVDGGTSNTVRKVGDGSPEATANDNPTNSEAFRCVYYLK
jgi:hypothetical protein